MWRQNSLVTVDKERKTFRYTPEYYVLKHASHYVRPGAKVLDIQGGYEDALAFLNPDGRIVLLLANQEDVPKTVGVSVRVQKDMPYNPGVKPFTLPANSINTILF